jgi:rubredoxin
VLYAKNFDPNSRTYIVHTQDVDKLELPTILIELSRKYFDELGNSVSEIDTTTAIKKEKKQLDVHQCQDCLTVYNCEYGDEEQGIEKGTLFKDLPVDYCCSLCEAPKLNFIILNTKKLDTI